MTAAQNCDLSIFHYRVIGAALLGLCLAGCALPPDAFQNYTAASRLDRLNETLDGLSVRRAESTNGRPLLQRCGVDERADGGGVDQ